LRVPPKTAAEKPRAGAMEGRPIDQTEFRMFYARGDLPIFTIHGPAYNRIYWKIEP
jgi:hypothetical protein